MQEGSAVWCVIKVFVKVIKRSLTSVWSENNPKIIRKIHDSFHSSDRVSITCRKCLFLYIFTVKNCKLMGHSNLSFFLSVLLCTPFHFSPHPFLPNFLSSSFSPPSFTTHTPSFHPSLPVSPTSFSSFLLSLPLLPSIFPFSFVTSLTHFPFLPPSFLLFSRVKYSGFYSSSYMHVLPVKQLSVWVSEWYSVH